MDKETDGVHVLACVCARITVQVLGAMLGKERRFNRIKEYLHSVLFKETEKPRRQQRR